MVLRHLLIVSQLQLLNSPLPDPGEPGLATELVAERVPERVPARESDVTITPASLQQCIQQQREQREQRAEVNRAATSAGARLDGKDEAGIDTSAQEEEQDEGRRRCDWVGTSSDAFEIAVCVLKVSPGIGNSSLSRASVCVRRVERYQIYKSTARVLSASIVLQIVKRWVLDAIFLDLVCKTSNLRLLPFDMKP